MRRRARIGQSLSTTHSAMVCQRLYLRVSSTNDPDLDYANGDPSKHMFVLSHRISFWLSSFRGPESVNLCVPYRCWCLTRNTDLWHSSRTWPQTPQLTTYLLSYSPEMMTPSFLILVHKVSSHYLSCFKVLITSFSCYPSMLNDKCLVKQCQLIVHRTLLLAGFKASRASRRHRGIKIMANSPVLCIRNATGLMSLLTTQATSWDIRTLNQYVLSFV